MELLEKRAAHELPQSEVYSGDKFIPDGGPTSVQPEQHDLIG